MAKIPEWTMFVAVSVVSSVGRMPLVATVIPTGNVLEATVSFLTIGTPTVPKNVLSLTAAESKER